MHSSPTASDVVFEGQLLLPVGDGPRAPVSLAFGRVVVRGGVIEQVIVGEGGPRADVGGGDYFIAPGFVDAHVHLAQFGVIGATGMPLLEWLARMVFPAEASWADEREAAAQAERAARSLLSFGTTAVAAYATSHAPGATAALHVLAELGMAGHVGQVLMDRGGPAELLVPAERALREAAGMRARGRVSPAVTPRFALSCSPELLAGAGRLAKATGWLVQTHVSETIEECEAVRELHDAPDYASVYDRAGLLGGRTLLAHGIHLSDDERRLIAGRGASIAHCPTANRFLRAGTFGRARALEAGVGVCLGSDVAGGPERSMVRVGRAMIEAAEAVADGQSRRPSDGPRVPTPAEAWWQITAGNAAVLGLEGCGQLRAGGDADVVVCRPDAGWRDAPDPLSYLLYAWDDRWIEGVWAAGVRRHGGPVGGG
ncbi:MAG: amidohydrolase family protein [Planctomycetota bacterium]|nr:amidohydrolase family protein [Planctomycetota bacterium]